MKIEGLAAVVTGGASGLGLASALALKEKGANVTVFDVHEEAGKRIAEQYGMSFVAVDVRSDDGVERAYQSAREFNGPERILVCCAGTGKATKTVWCNESTGDFECQSTSIFDEVIQINLVGTMRCIHHSALAMAHGDLLNDDGERGVIVCTGSIAAFDGVRGQTAYAASKAGIGAIVLPLARDLGEFGIRAVTIHPGAFDTAMLRSTSQSLRENFAAETPFPNRLGDPSEFGMMVLQACENPMINGTAIRLDGGLRMRGDLV